jgi:hypothetical protein
MHTHSQNYSKFLYCYGFGNYLIKKNLGFQKQEWPMQNSHFWPNKPAAAQSSLKKCSIEKNRQEEDRHRDVSYWSKHKKALGILFLPRCSFGINE